MILITRLRHNIESRLYRLGFSSSVVRRLLAVQILISFCGLLVGAAVFWLSLWPLLFGVGASLACFSLWHIARFAQANIQTQYTPAMALRLFLGLNARLALIAIVLFALIVWLKAPVAPLLIGLSSTVAGIVVWGISRLSRKTVKEA